MTFFICVLGGGLSLPGAPWLTYHLHGLWSLLEHKGQSLVGSWRKEAEGRENAGHINKYQKLLFYFEYISYTTPADFKLLGPEKT